ncbi:MAG: xanthine dehydrogenase accessory protein XdhC [Xanthomonadales bacterium]|nr:xanthine dehydrogenase accessory protein XdhC [Xanthomonadales bacterium]
MTSNWVSALLDRLEQEACVLVTLRPRKGSAPRESGARMIVTRDALAGSIGGGNLEFEAIATAREMLDELGGVPRVEPYGLGPALNQCCGGSVELLFEPLAPPAPEWLRVLDNARAHGDPAVLATATQSTQHHVALPVGRESALPEALRAPVRALLDDPQAAAIEVVLADSEDWWLQRISESRRSVMLFGAGHVGRAVVRALADLPFEIRWVDGRADAFPETIPDNTTRVASDDPVAEVSAAPPNAIFIVMTHSHELDEDLCHAILERGSFDFLGLIGSATKRRRFVHRLGRRGIDEQALERLVCPLGLPAIRGKEPATIALGLAAQLMSEPNGG